MSDGIEEAIIALVVSGAAEASAVANRVEVDLTSAERAGKRAEAASSSAEKAAGEAERSVASLESQARSALFRLTLAAHALNRIAKAAGASDATENVLESATTGLSAAAGTARSLAFLGPEIALPAAALVGGFVGTSSYLQRSSEQQARDAKELAKGIADELKANPPHVDVSAVMLQQAGVARLDALTAPRRGVQ